MKTYVALPVAVLAFSLSAGTPAQGAEGPPAWAYFKHGARAGIGSALMKPIVEKLTVEGMMALAAYIASLAP